MCGATLLISLGTSPAIVPEAFLLPEISFDAVHVLTSDSTDVSFVEEWFAGNARNVILTITRVAGFKDFKSEEDHFRFEEVLYRWMLANRGSEPPFVCLSGGFKTMSAAMQKAAAVLGASEVFHVLCDLPLAQQPNTEDQIRAACNGGHLHWIKLGPEDGWPQLHSFSASQYPLKTVREEGKVCWVTALDRAFRTRLAQIVQRSHNIAGAWDELGDLPFPVLATWSGADLAWLRQPVELEKDFKWIAALPKVELHCHLGGFATHGEALEAVRAEAENFDCLPTFVEPTPPSGWPFPTAPLPLSDYMKLGDANGSSLLRDEGCLKAQCRQLYAHFLTQNVLYAEVRCSPANYASEGRSPWQVLTDIKTIFDRCMDERPGCHVNIIIIGTRKEKGDYRTAISRHLALAVSAAEHWTRADECRVVGVDLAGFEDKETRAHYFREEFTGIHRCGLALTVHAGENDEAEGIWRAVFDLNARRLGHALHLIDSPELLQSVADRGVGVEMCPYANYQIKGFHPMRSPGESPRPPYPLLDYLRAGVRVTVNTDNIGISGASLTENLVHAARLCPGFTRMDTLWVQANALAIAFISPAQRERFRAAFQSRLIQP